MDDERFKMSHQPEILHQVQKEQQVLSTFNDKIMKGLELFISPQKIVNNLTGISFALKLLYYGCTNLLDQQTLGEEFSYIRLYNKNDHIFLSRNRQVIFVLLKAFGAYFFNRYFYYIASNNKKN